MSKKKICIFTSMIYPVPAVRGGAVEGLVELMVRMNEIYNAMELTVISVYDNEAVRKAKGYKNTEFIFIKKNSIDGLLSKKIFIYINKIGIKFKGKTLVSMPYVKRSWKKVAGKEFDQYVLEGGGDCYNFGYLSKVIPKNKLAVHFHGEVPGDRAIEGWFGKCITVSNYIARKLICNGAVEKSKVYVLPNCYDAESMKTNLSREAVRNKFGVKNTDFVFVYWGRLLPEKGVFELIEAFEKIVTPEDNNKLLIIGNANFGYGTKSEYDEQIEKKCTSQSLKDKVIFTGFVNHDEMGSFLEACDVGIIPSIWDDPAPLTVFEGLSKGLPVIANRVGGIPEIISDGENGVLLNWTKGYSDDLAENMRKLRFDDQKRKELSQNAIKTVEKFSAEKYYDNFLKIIES